MIQDEQNSEGAPLRDGLPVQAPSPHDTFWSKVVFAGNDDCWLWQAYCRDGYGIYWAGKRGNVSAHRFSVEISGREIPNGMVVDHTCRNRSCVNPSHLRVVDRKTNVHENSDAVAFHKAQQTHCIRGHELAGQNLGIKKTSGSRYCKTCTTQSLREWRARQRLAQNG